ncbi:glutathione S-transferase [Halovulum dunhuangense]|uniref:Glutathione S-transferase n=1 Tax=Halovulum dunhuangense TaxID=1505036 RepID=A0A849KY36_9RHOB|nr:glutathione S-transferase [Halovulum dunhuangense]NNU78886.1 glutathione S-transferase [Halovulum dunhuangense]
MTYTLAITARTYSSWSLRGWLMFAKFGLSAEIVEAPMKTPAFTAMLAEFGPARTVPALRFDDVALWDSLAIAETLAERHPQAGHWPRDPRLRGLARSLVAEMHSGFTALRGACPMNLRNVNLGFVPSDAVLADLDRLSTLWAAARAASGSTGPWLFGDYTAADAFFAPVAARITGYGLPVNDADAAYVAAQMADPAFVAWRAEGLARDAVIESYELGYETRDWP